MYFFNNLLNLKDQTCRWVIWNIGQLRLCRVTTRLILPAIRLDILTFVKVICRCSILKEVVMEDLMHKITLTLPIKRIQY